MHPLSQLKLEHSDRVAADSLILALDMNWCEADLRTAEALGLLHDIGRFDQLRRFGTFADHKSVDHGAHGYDIAKEKGLSDHFPSAARQAILDGIRYHNQKFIPEHLDQDSLRFVKLIRDADKLDILLIISDTLRRKAYLTQPEILLEVDIDGPPTPALVREILDTRSASYSNVHSLADFGLMRLNWVYDLNYDISCRLFHERGLFSSILKTLPDTPEIRRIIQQAETHLDNRQGARGSMTNPPLLPPTTG